MQIVMNQLSPRLKLLGEDTIVLYNIYISNTPLTQEPIGVWDNAVHCQPIQLFLLEQ